MSCLSFSKSYHPQTGFIGYTNIGKLRLGWVIQTRRDSETFLLKEWPYATRHGTGIRVPFPVTITEWEKLQKVLKDSGIPVPSVERENAEKSIENADLRFELSHATNLEQPLIVPGLKGELFGFQEAGVRYASTMGWRCLIGDDMGLGKAQPLDAKILTPTGWKNMGEIRVGAFVIGSDGEPTKVLNVYPQGSLSNYQITLDGGETTHCCLDHLWNVQSENGQIETLSLSNILLKPMGTYSIPVLKKGWKKMMRATAKPRTLMQCIRVEAEDHLYVTDDYIVTHNTIQGLACALESGSKRVVVVTRAVAVEGWHRSVIKFTPYSVRVGTGVAPVEIGKKGNVKKVGIGEFPDDYVPLDVKLPKMKDGEEFKFDTKEAMDGAKIGTRGMKEGVLVLNYDIIAGWEEAIRNFDPEILIFDEAHAIKEPSSKRSQVAHRLMVDIEKVICLSGTPIPNRPKEFFHLEDQLHPGKWGDWFKFAHRYCDAKLTVIGYDWRTTNEWVDCTVCRGKGCKQCFGKGKKQKKVREEKKAWDFDGASNQKEMYERMRGFGMVRRMKDDVLDLMPPMQETILLEATKRYRDVEKGFMEIVEGNFNPLANKKDEATMHELFAAAAADKIDWAKSWLGDFIEDTEEKIVIFFHHQVVGNALVEWLTEQNVGFVKAFGLDKDKNVEQEFQTNPKCRIALCSYGVAREAVTLTQSSYMLCLEYAWVPGWMQQAMDRIRRIGQERVCNYYFPVIRNSVEERIVNAFMQKQDILSVIMQGKILRSVNIELE